MIGPLLAALTAAGGMAMQQGAIDNQNNINWSALFETKRSNRKAESLARSTKRDAYGNEVEYIEGVGWVPNLTDITKQILSAEQKERHANLTQDAPRNRAAAERKDKRSQVAGKDFEKAYNEYKFRPRRNEAEYKSKATQELLGTRRKGLDEAAALLARQLMRTGGSSQLASIYKQADDAYAGSLAEATLKGEQIGAERFNRDNTNDARHGQGEAGFYKSIADDTTTSPVDFSGFNEQISGQAEAGLQGLIKAIRQSQGATADSMGNLAHSMGQSPDISSLSNALASLSFRAGGDTTRDNEDEEMERLMQLLQMSRQGAEPGWQNDFSAMRNMF